jgi:hypothetical protein
MDVEHQGSPGGEPIIIEFADREGNGVGFDENALRHQNIRKFCPI